MRYNLPLVVLSDCDGVWLGDAVAYAKRAAPDADVLVAGSHLTPGGASNDSGLEPPSARLVGMLDTGALLAGGTGLRGAGARGPLEQWAPAG